MKNQQLDWSIKICGVTSSLDAEFVAHSGATAIGLNFYSRSLRSVTIPQAVTIVSHLQKIADTGPSVVPVALFVNHSAATIREITHATGIHRIQLHGDENLEIMSALDSMEVIRVLRVDPENDLEHLVEEALRWTSTGARAILLDAPVRKKPIDDAVDSTPGYGGLGETIDWTVAQQLVERLPVPVILAGGLNPQNVAAAITAAHPAAVDVASGVEELPGKKNPQLVQSFVTQAKTAGL